MKNGLIIFNNKRVIIGQNPGKDGDFIPNNSCLAFYWIKKNANYRLAAAFYNTSF